MDFHKIDAVGKIYMEEVETLPTWVSGDRRRLVFNYYDNYMYYGGKTGWNRILIQGDLDEHINDLNNPHEVTTLQISAAPQTELDDHINDLDNPHEVTAVLLGAALQTDLDNHTNDLNNPHETLAGNSCTIYVWDEVGSSSWDIPAGTRYIDITCVGGGQQTDGSITGAAGNYSRTITSSVTPGASYTVTVGDMNGNSSFGSLCVATCGNSVYSLVGCVGDITLLGGRGQIDTDDPGGKEESEGAASFFGCAPAPGGGCSCHAGSVVTSAGIGIVIVECYHS